MIAAAFLVLLRPYSIQCVLLLLLLLLGTVATILFFCCWHRRLRDGKHPIKSVFSGGRSRSRVGLRTHHFRSEFHIMRRVRNLPVGVQLGMKDRNSAAPRSGSNETRLEIKGFRHSPHHLRRSIHARLTEEKPSLVEVPESEPELPSTVRNRKVKKRVLPEFYQTVQVTPTRKVVGITLQL